ncbi:MAG: hypothetical protein ACRYFZ_24375 [Janthinobacterium lividum]
MSDALPSSLELPGAEQVPLPDSTGLERIYAAYLADNLKSLSPKDKLLHSELEAAYALILNYHSFETAWPLLARQFSLGRSTCYNRLRDAQNLFGDVKKVKKEGRRNVLLEYARKLLFLSLSQRPPDMKNALAAMKFEADIAGLRRADSHNEDNGPGTGNTSYILNLTLQGRKSRQFDLTHPEDISDADWELVNEAVNENVVGADQMELLLTQAKEGDGKL